ncbi:MAG: DUF5312 family protein, partial [Termitinemataceae bacterium]
MQDLDTFDRLVSQLSIEERQTLLAKLNDYALLSKEVLFNKEDIPASVAVLATGDEVYEPDGEVFPGGVRDSNR